MAAFSTKVEPLDAPKRKRRRCRTSELEARLAVAMPWVRDSPNSPATRLRMDEAARVTIGTSILRPVSPLQGEDQKSAGMKRLMARAIGWRLVQRLVRQARARDKTPHHLAWPQPHLECANGSRSSARAWRPLRSVRKSWQHRQGCRHREASALHDVRARTSPRWREHEVVTDDREAARHRDSRPPIATSISRKMRRRRR